MRQMKYIHLFYFYQLARKFHIVPENPTLGYAYFAELPDSPIHSLHNRKTTRKIKEKMGQVN